MALVNVVNMVVLDNPTNFMNPFQFEITFECLQELEDDLEWKVLYVGSAESSTHDQVLDEILVGPVPVGINRFVLQADAPDHTRIPPEDLLGVTVVLVTCGYKEQEFIRIGYYVNNEYITTEEECDPRVGLPEPPIDTTRVTRTILADKPRVTRFPINWTGGRAGSLNVNDTMALVEMTEEDKAAALAMQNDEQDCADENENDDDEMEEEEDGEDEVLDASLEMTSPPDKNRRVRFDPRIVSPRMSPERQDEIMIR